MKYLVTIEGPAGSSIVPEEFFSRVKTRWIWVKERQHPSLQNQSDDFTESDHAGMCIVDQESLAHLSNTLATAPGAGILSIRVYPLSNN